MSFPKRAPTAARIALLSPTFRGQGLAQKDSQFAEKGRLSELHRRELLPNRESDNVNVLSSLVQGARACFINWCQGISRCRHATKYATRMGLDTFRGPRVDKRLWRGKLRARVGKHRLLFPLPTWRGEGLGHTHGRLMRKCMLCFHWLFSEPPQLTRILSWSCVQMSAARHIES